jgi:DNA polymerase-3 subunit gamma/tau
MSQVIARRYRPQSFEQVIGQEAIVRTLRNGIASGRIGHGFIFSGHRGIGKTSVARIMAMALNCRAGEGPTVTPCGVCDSCREIREGGAVDVIEIDAASNRGIDEIRALRERVRYRPARDRYKFFILDEAHQLTGDAFNALLKTLEEPPEWAVFVLATTEPEALPATIRSRCQHFAFRAVPYAVLLEHLTGICQQEQVTAEAEALELIAEAGEGSVRDALSVLDQAITHGGQSLTGAAVRSLLGRVSAAQIQGLLDAVAEDSPAAALERAAALLGAGVGPAQVAWQLTQAVRNALIAQCAAPLLECSESERTAALRAAGQFREEELARFLQILLRTSADLRHGQQERLHFELALVRMLHARRLNSVEEVLAALGGGAAPASSPAPPRPLPPPPIPQPKHEPAPVPKAASAAPAPPTSLARAQTEGPDSAIADPTAAVLGALEAAGKNSVLSVVSKAEWRWDSGRLELIFTGAQAGMAALAQQASMKNSVLTACRTALGRQPDLTVTARPEATSDGASTAAVVAPPREGSAEARAAQHPLLRQLREKIPSHVLKTRDLAPS